MSAPPDASPCAEPAPADGTVIRHTHGVAAEQGRRWTMEDSHAAHPDLGDGVALYLVCDGHAGRRIADAAPDLLCKAVRDAGRARLQGDPVAALSECFVAVDREMYRQQVANQTICGGATCVAAVVVGNEVCIANLGDSRAVMSEGGVAVQLSWDQKPKVPAERQRVEAAGGKIQIGRVSGELAVTRAFGNFKMKHGDKVLTEEPLVVSNVPEVTRHPLSRSSDFLILACDGVWDVLSCEDAVAKCAEHRAEGPQGMAEALVAHALEKRSLDNVSAMVVVFSVGVNP